LSILQIGTGTISGFFDSGKKQAVQEERSGVPDKADAPGVGGQLSGPLRRHGVRRVEHRAA